jgi:serine/threonine protein kinase
VFALAGENLGKNWSIRYKIIKGICEGLRYLQEGLEFPIIFHLDLKPDNVLLSQLMTPKTSDFGLSRLIGEENTKKTLTPLGTM